MLGKGSGRSSKASNNPSPFNTPSERKQNQFSYNNAIPTGNMSWQMDNYNDQLYYNDNGCYYPCSDMQYMPQYYPSNQNAAWYPPQYSNNYYYDQERYYEGYPRVEEKEVSYVVNEPEEVSSAARVEVESTFNGKMLFDPKSNTLVHANEAKKDHQRKRHRKKSSYVVKKSNVVKPAILNPNGDRKIASEHQNNGGVEIAEKNELDVLKKTGVDSSAGNAPMKNIATGRNNATKSSGVKDLKKMNPTKNASDCVESKQGKNIMKHEKIHDDKSDTTTSMNQQRDANNMPNKSNGKKVKKKYRRKPKVEKLSAKDAEKSNAEDVEKSNAENAEKSSAKNAGRVEKPKVEKPKSDIAFEQVKSRRTKLNEKKALRKDNGMANSKVIVNEITPTTENKDKLKIPKKRKPRYRKKIEKSTSQVS